MDKTDYERGRIDGFCCIEAKYPNNENYMSGYTSGHRAAEIEWIEKQRDYAPKGPNDSHDDSFYC